MVERCGRLWGGRWLSHNMRKPRLHVTSHMGQAVVVHVHRHTLKSCFTALQPKVSGHRRKGWESGHRWTQILPNTVHVWPLRASSIIVLYKRPQTQTMFSLKSGSEYSLISAGPSTMTNTLWGMSDHLRRETKTCFWTKLVKESTLQCLNLSFLLLKFFPLFK